MPNAATTNLRQAVACHTLWQQKWLLQLRQSQAQFKTDMCPRTEKVWQATLVVSNQTCARKCLASLKLGMARLGMNQVLRARFVGIL
uniref:Uncharacterized protein n=1 Tax=Arundo donax TaxID=35708 RepID=A0A0A9CZY7_ARUDO